MGCGALISRSHIEPPAENEPTESLKVVEETVRPDRNSFVANDVVPPYWHNKKAHAGDKDAFDDMFYVPDSCHHAFDHLLASTYVGKATQDRPCPKTKDAHARTPGGCPCVQPGGDPGLPVAFRVQRVIRVEASSMWSKYNGKMRAIFKKRGDVTGAKLGLLTSKAIDDNRDLFDPLDFQRNEVYGFHGTFVRAALSITSTDFKLNLSGSNRGGLFGKGLYFTDSVTKADEYAKDEPDGYYNNTFAVLVCRICMGLPYHTNDDQKAGDKIKKGDFDSTCGQRMFKELVVYDSNQVYPEYVVLYKRVYKKNAQAYIDNLLRHRFFMEVPLHWRNNSKALKDGFLEQHRGTSHLNVFLQTVLDRSTGGRSNTVKASSRIENSVLWERYVSFKTYLRNRLGGQDGRSADDPDLGSVEEDIEMCRYSNDAGAESLARAAGYRLPIDELDPQLNEHLMWFGGTKEQKEQLCRGAFTKDAMENTRETFCQDVVDALDNVRSEKGMKYVVLCRVVCGTSEDCDDSIGVHGKHLVGIINPNQIYPEYAIDVFSEEDLKNESTRCDEEIERGKKEDDSKREGLEALLMPELLQVNSDENI